jgi:hypothetical protein
MLKTFIHLDALDYVKYANVYMEEIGPYIYISFFVEVDKTSLI